MKTKFYLILIVLMNAHAAFSQFNKEVLFNMENVDLLTRPNAPNTYDFGMGVKSINLDATKQATPGSKAFINYYCSEDYVGIHFFSDIFNSSNNQHADWSKYSQNAYITFWINTNDGGAVILVIGWNDGTSSEKYWSSHNITINTNGKWEKHFIKLSDLVYRDNWGNGEITFPDLTIEPKLLTVVFENPRKDISSSPMVNLSIDDIEIWDTPLDAPLKVIASEDRDIVCGEYTQLSASTNYQGAEKLSYLWTPSEGLSAVDIPNPIINISSNTTYTVTVTTPDAGSAKDSVNVKIQPLTVSIQNQIISCGNTAQLKLNTNYTGTDQLKYKWTPSDGLSSDSIENPFVTLNAIVEYSVEVKTENGCTANSRFVLNPSVIDIGASICMVTVDSADKNVVVCQQDPNAAVDSFYIYRESLNQTDQYDLIGKISNSETNEFVDSNSNTRLQSNKYKIAIKDICGFTTSKSAAHKTMHLMVNRGVGNNWNLIWEPYIGAPISNYKIFRGTSKSDLIQIGSSSGSNISFTDETSPTGDVYYQVALELNQSCTRLKSAGNVFIRSNIINTKEISTNIITKSKTEAITFPNPATDVLNIRTSGSSNLSILIFDLNGKQVFCKQINAESIDISNLSKGIYTLKLNDSGSITVSKFVKE